MHIDLKYLRSLFLNFLADSCYALIPAVPQPSDVRKSVLIVRLDAIGDFVLWLDSAKAMREMYPPDKYRLILLGNLLWTELAEQVPYFDDVVAVDRKRLFNDLRYRCRIWHTIRKAHAYLALNPVFSRDFNIDDSAIRVSRAVRRVGFRGDCTNHPAWKNNISDRWYTELIEAPAADECMELERNATIVRFLGNESFRAGLPELTLARLKANRFQGTDYIVVVPCTSDVIKQWPVINYAELLNVLCNETQHKILICGAPGEEATGNALKDMVTTVGKLDSIEVLSGKTSLMEYIGIIKHALFVVGNDSSAIHIAAAVGTPSLCIAGGGHFGRFVPYHLEKPSDLPVPIVITHPMDCFGCNYRDCKNVQGDGAALCLHNIDAQEVYTHIRQLRG